MVDAATAISAEAATLIAGNEDDLDGSDPLLMMKTSRMTITS